MYLSSLSDETTWVSGCTFLGARPIRIVARRIDANAVSLEAGALGLAW